MCASNLDLGLGQIACYSLVKMNNGTITVQSDGIKNGKLVTIMMKMPVESSDS